LFSVGDRDVIISLEDVHARRLLDGSKCVELRRRAPHLREGTRVWFYVKVPVGKILGFGTLAGVTVASPASLWAKYDRCAGLSEAEFEDYFSGTGSGAVLEFSAITPLEQSIALSELRELHAGFQPPQFYARLTSEALRRRLHSSHFGKEFRPCAHENGSAN
jgi:predicted transcriptional regulator